MTERRFGDWRGKNPGCLVKTAVSRFCSIINDAIRHMDNLVFRVARDDDDGQWEFN